MLEQHETMERLGQQVKSALEAADLEAYADLLDPNVHWGPPDSPSPPCQNREQVLSWYRHGRDSGARAHVSEVSVLGNRLLVGLKVAGTEEANERGGIATRWQILTVRDGRVVDIVGFETRGEAVAHAGPDAPSD